METHHRFNSQKLFLALCNLNIFGLGYLLTDQIKRWSVLFFGNLVLVAAAQVTNASKNPLPWAAVFILVFFGMAVDLWLMLQKNADIIGKKLNKKGYFLPLTAVMINLFFYGGFFAYRQSGFQLLKSAEEAYASGYYEQSRQDYSNASTYYRLSLNPAVAAVDNRVEEISLILESQDLFAKGEYLSAMENIAKFKETYPDSTRKNDMSLLEIDACLTWAQELQTQGKYEACQEKLEQALKIQSSLKSARTNEINSAMAENYLLWGQSLAERKYYEQAIEKFEIILNKYKNSAVYEPAYEGAANAYYHEAVSFIESNKNFELAASDIEIILVEYAKSEVVRDAALKKPAALLGWGKSLRDKKEFLKAREKFDEIKTLTEDNTMLAEVDAEIQITNDLLARDNGSDGEVEILFTMQETCAGFPASRPTIDLFPDEPGKAMMCDGSDYLLPSEAIADTPGTFRYIVGREDGSRRIQACPYTRGHTLERWVNTTEITVKFVKDGKVFIKRTFTGAPPPACPAEYAFYADTDLSWGEWVDDKEISEWLAKVFK